MSDSRGFKMAYVLDGDNIRHGLCKDLSFSEVDRKENIRRISEVAKLFAQSNVLCITAFISPFRISREQAKAIIGEDQFLEVYISADLEVCEDRDTKGLYKKARKGEVQDFTGISSPYEPPFHPDIVLDSGSLSVDKCVEDAMVLLKKRGFILSRRNKE